jgi:hypothetical protein
MPLSVLAPFCFGLFPVGKKLIMLLSGLPHSFLPLSVYGILFYATFQID